MPFVNRDAQGNITGRFARPQIDGQEFLADDSTQFKTHLLKRAGRERKRDLAEFARRRMVDRLFADSPEKVTSAAGEVGINAAKDEAGVERAFQTALKMLQ